MRGLGDRDEAMEWLEHVYREHSLWLTLWARAIRAWTSCARPADSRIS
jgi:hypothetical protein